MEKAKVNKLDEKRRSRYFALDARKSVEASPFDSKWGKLCGEKEQAECLCSLEV